MIKLGSKGDAVHEEIARRLDRVERENRRMKVAIGVLLAMVAAVLLMGQARPPTIVEAQEFIVRNAEGKRVVRLAAGPDGQPSLAFFDQQEDARILLYLYDRGTPGISLLAGPPSKGTLHLAVYPDSAPSIAWTDGNGSVRAKMALDSRGSTVSDQAPYIYFLDRNGEAGNLTWAAPP